MEERVPVVPIELPNGKKEEQGISWTTEVDLDAESTKEKRANARPNVFRFRLVRTKKLDMFALEAYLNKQTDFNSKVLECMTFLDHLMRTGPSKYLLAIKRSFYSNVEKQGAHLGFHVYAYKGVYQAARIAQASGDRPGLARLLVNADVSNGCFWGPNVSLLAIIVEMIGTNHEQLVHDLRPRQIGKTVIDQKHDSPGMRQALRLRGIRFKVKYRNMPPHLADKVHVVDKVISENPETYFFDYKDKTTGVTKKTSMAMYFHNVYDHDFDRAGAIVLTKGGVAYPMEICYVVPGQRYPFKLYEHQTSAMIKFAVTRPDIRASEINKGIESLNWANDRYLQHYGLKIEKKMVQTRARLLQPPRVEFGKKRTVDPKTNGQWSIEGQEFIEKNVQPLQHWGVMQLNHFGRQPQIGEAEIQHFLQLFTSEYVRYGGNVVNKRPIIMNGSGQDLGKAVAGLYAAVAKNCNANEKPQLLVFIVNGKAKDNYDRLKKSCDCRFGVVSQVMQSIHVVKHAPQYIGNVLMKVNAKLGGCTARALPSTGKPGTGHTYFNTPTMIIGADVSHPGPGALGSSMAAVSVSLDKSGIKYVAACETNGHRIEVIAPWNWNELVRPLLIQWLIKFNGTVPKHVIYIRDGVSAGQYQQILQYELRDMKNVWETIPNLDMAKVKEIKYTVIIASKRHHIRMFPADHNKDRNNNALPGTLVERDVTTARDWDFYLCAHKAIQGTSRPVHYAVIKDEMYVKPDYLIQMIYDQSYQYVRSTTSVSIHPAVYYAHLAARRSVGHERDSLGYGRGGTHKPSEELERAELEAANALASHTGKLLTTAAIKRLQYLTEQDNPPLVGMNNDIKILETMWFV